MDVLAQGGWVARYTMRSETEIEGGHSAFVQTFSTRTCTRLVHADIFYTNMHEARNTQQLHQVLAVL